MLELVGFEAGCDWRGSDRAVRTWQSLTGRVMTGGAVSDNGWDFEIKGIDDV